MIIASEGFFVIIFVIVLFSFMGFLFLIAAISDGDLKIDDLPFSYKRRLAKREARALSEFRIREKDIELRERENAMYDRIIERKQ